LNEVAARRLREWCGGAAPGAPKRVGSRGKGSTEEGSTEDSCTVDSCIGNSCIGIVVGRIGGRAGGLHRPRNGHMTVA